MAEPIGDDELQRLRELERETVECPWQYVPSVGDNIFAGNRRIADVYGAGSGSVGQNVSNARFIAISRNSLPGLLARIDAAESRAAELQREVERLRIHKSQEISKPDDVVWRFTCHECGHHKHVVVENFSHCPSCGSKVRYWDNGSLQ